MEETRFYICGYCKVEYIPKRRRVQEYCSNTCRSKAWYARTGKKKVKEIISVADTNALSIKSPKEKMSLAGTGDAVVGSLLADGIKKVFTKEENKAATKGDLLGLLAEIKGRYHPINNLQPDNFGRKPYYDIISQEVVYLGNGDISNMFNMG